MTLSPVLSIPTVGKSPPGGTPTSLRPTTVPLRVKNTWGAQHGGVTPMGGAKRPLPPQKHRGKGGSKARQEEPKGGEGGIFEGAQTHGGVSETHSGVTPKHEGRAGRPQPPKKWGQRG